MFSFLLVVYVISYFCFIYLANILFPEVIWWFSCHRVTTNPVFKKTIIPLLASVLNESSRLRAPTHRTDIKELAAARADCCVTSHQPVSRPKAALEHGWQPTAQEDTLSIQPGSRSLYSELWYSSVVWHHSCNYRHFKLNISNKKLQMAPVKSTVLASIIY